MEMPTIQGIRLMVADRASGLCIILLVMFAALSLMDLSRITVYSAPLLLLAACVTVAAYVFFCRLLLRQNASTMLRSLPYSFIGQMLWVVTLLVILISLSDGAHGVEYIVLYCAASIAGMLPFSVGGLGIKEMTYFYGATLIQRFTGAAVDGDLAISLSLCLFSMTFIGSLPGLLWLSKVGKMRHE